MKRRIALVGTPNAGKTALFNTLTHSNQRVANYTGVTVESAEADFRLEDGELATLVDLPGAYSLRPYTEDESVLTTALLGDQFEGMIIVVDATQPARAIRFLVEVLDATDLPAVIALNMIDLAGARDFEYDLVAFKELVGVPVVPTVATKRRGLQEITVRLSHALKTQTRAKDAFLGEKKQNLSNAEVSLQIVSFYKKSDEFLKRVLLRKGKPDLRSEKIDRVLLHPLWGMLILVLVLGITFQLMFNLAKIPMDAIDGFFSWLGGQVNGSPLPEGVRSFLADGIIAGVGSTLVFLPQILILFGLILFLEDFGFMARAVFLLDHWMGKVGLHGRACFQWSEST